MPPRRLARSGIGRTAGTLSFERGKRFAGQWGTAALNTKVRMAIALRNDHLAAAAAGRNEEWEE